MKIGARLRSLAEAMFRRSSLERDMQAELRFHIESYTEDLVRSGVPRPEAERRARVEFGAVEALKEECRQARGLRVLDELNQDLRYAARVLRKRPGFTMVATVTLALGMGANAAIFSVIQAVLLKSLPYPDPDRLVIMSERQLRGETFSVAWPNFVDWRDQNRSFEAMAVFQQEHFDLSGVPQPTMLRGGRVSAALFTLLGAQPILGRTFSEADDIPGAKPVALLSYQLWRSQLAADPGIVGRTLVLSGAPYIAIGVLPPEFKFFPGQTDVYVPAGVMGGNPGWRDRSNHGSLRVLARLRPGVSLAAARAEMDVIAIRLERQYPKSNSGHRAAITRLYDERLGHVEPMLYMLLAAVGLVLLITCANVANLLVARAAGRQREFAIRAAIGAGRMRIVRQLLTESVLLSTLGGALGLLVAWWAIPLLVRIAPQGIPRLAETRVDGAVLWFTAGISLLTGLLFGLAPAFHASKLEVNDALKQAASPLRGTSRHGLRAGLLVGEVALAVVLVTASGLLIRSLIETLRVNPGFNPDHVLALDIILLNPKYRQPEQQVNFFTQAVERIKALTGVRDAGAAVCPPPNGDCWDYFYSIEGRPVTSPSETPVSDFNAVDPGYFRAMEIPLVEGRYFTGADRRGSPGVAIVNQSMARRWWPKGSAVGKRINYGASQAPDALFEIVGVVGDVKREGLDAEQRTEVFFSAAQMNSQAMVIVLRAAGDPPGLAAAAEREIHAFDKDQPVRIQPLTQSMAQSLAGRRFSTLLLGIFGAVALLLAAVGIYGVTSYAVAQRTQEIGVRKALGAQQGDVIRLVVGQEMLWTLAGVAIGIAGALAVTRWLSSLLFGVTPSDPVTFVAVPLVLAAVAFVAGYVPVRRATRVDPLVALRYE